MFLKLIDYVTKTLFTWNIYNLIVILPSLWPFSHLVMWESEASIYKQSKRWEHDLGLVKEHGGLGAKYPSIYLGMLKNKKPKYKLSAPHKTILYEKKEIR